MSRAFCLLLLLPLASHADDVFLTPAKKEHWAWRKPQRPDVPKVKQADWVRNPIDAFILSGLEEKGLTPASPAAKEQLLRRVTFDLVGLPPTPKEIDDFLADS